MSAIIAQLGPLTVVMKGESIPANSAWIGAPAEPFVHAEHADAQGRGGQGGRLSLAFACAAI